MAYNEALANRIRESLCDFPNIEEMEMMGGLAFMLNDKMCVGVFRGNLMCRINPEMNEVVVEKTGCTTMVLGKRPMLGYVLIEEEGRRTKKDFDYWINLCLEFNPLAKSSRKKEKNKLKLRSLNHSLNGPHDYQNLSTTRSYCLY